jgi:60 kDa SS-A/Ro ribonucleoprotein
MASVNVKEITRTHEGGRAKVVNAKAQFLRTLNSCFLWEDGFYEDGVEVAERLAGLTKECAKIDLPWTVEQVVKARREIGLRHAPLWCLIALAEERKLTKAAVAATLMRPDDATELLALYWKGKKKPVPASFKKGLAAFFTGLDEYRLAKYGTRDGAVRLRDILFLSHAKPKSEEQAALWKRFIAKQLPEPETWEHLLSAGADKKATFEKLIGEEKLGALALIRNLRNMIEAGVTESLIMVAILNAKTERIFPYQILQAAQYAPRFEGQLEEMLFKCLADYGKLKGTTLFLIDRSGSMNDACGGRNAKMNRYAAAVSLAVMLREICEDARIVTFNGDVQEIPPRRGFGLVQALGSTTGNTRLGKALGWANGQPHDRIIVISDEQTADRVPDPVAAKAYMVNPAANKEGVGYGKWIHIDGFSTQVVEFILGCERD